ncbi:hypothetical protein BB560_002687 [Smittium megazygosporum]|uniref:Uncharacterized protein n=1 Tax=Smittium megazygosporum TaxID=133381 RepID=A0A2T9ZE23_9FUNG|nr:hypothetical protein BB560_002687 [Smittium megazygosporum]
MQSSSSKDQLTHTDTKQNRLFTSALRNWASFQLNKKTFQELSFEAASQLMVKPEVIMAAGSFVSQLLFFGNEKQNQKNIIGRGKMLLTSIMISAMKKDIVNTGTEHDQDLAMSAGNLVSSFDSIVSEYIESNFTLDPIKLKPQISLFKQKYKEFTSIFLKWKDADKKLSLKYLNAQSKELDLFQNTIRTKFPVPDAPELSNFASNCSNLIKKRIDQFSNGFGGFKQEISSLHDQAHSPFNLPNKKLKMSVSNVEIEYDPVLVHEFIFNPKSNVVPSSSFLHTFNPNSLKRSLDVTSSSQDVSSKISFDKNLSVFLKIANNFRSLLLKCIPEIRPESSDAGSSQNERKANLLNKLSIKEYLNPDRLKLEFSFGQIDISSLFLYTISKVYKISAPIRDVETKALEAEVLENSTQNPFEISSSHLQLSAKIVLLLENVYFDLIGFYLESSTKFSDIHDVFSSKHSSFLVDHERKTFELLYRLNSNTNDLAFFAKNMESNIPNTVKWIRNSRSYYLSDISVPSCSTPSSPSKSLPSGSKSPIPNEFCIPEKEMFYKHAICSLLFAIDNGSDFALDGINKIETLSLDKRRLLDIQTNIQTLISIACILPYTEAYFEKRLFSKNKFISQLIALVTKECLSADPKCINYESSGDLTTYEGLNSDKEIKDIGAIILDSLQKLLTEELRSKKQSLKLNLAELNHSSRTIYKDPNASQVISYSPTSSYQTQISGNYPESSSESLYLSNEPIINSRDQTQISTLLKYCKMMLNKDSQVFKLLNKRLYSYVCNSILFGKPVTLPKGYILLEQQVVHIVKIIEYFCKVNYHIYSDFYQNIS